ncbi:MAG: cysteine hydrolase family protein, partial [Nocardioidaceae bacterium]
MSRSYGPGTALVVVDVQNDFADPAGSLYVRGGEQVVQAVNAEVEAARAAASPVVYTQDWHPPETPHFEKDGGKWPVHCVMGTWGAEL